MPLEARGSSMGIGRGGASLARLLRRASATRGGAAAGPRAAPPPAAAPPPLGASPAHFPAAAAPAAARLLARAASSSSRAAAAAAAEPAAAPADAAAAAEEPGAGLTMADLPTSDESDALLRVRHSCAHLMAMAVQRLHKGAQCTIGPWTERGFFYDFSMPGPPLADKDLPKIRKEMQRLVRKDLPITAEEVTSAEARARIEAAGEPFKLEILDSILARDPAAPITIYHIGAVGEKDHWWDLCAGPHVASTGAIDPEAFDLESTAGAYWRGDDARPMLSRVSGTAWADAGQLAAYRRLRAEAARRDHRRLGAELDLFSIREEAGGGLVFWHPKGAMVRHLVETFWKEAHLRRGYDLLYTPHIARAELWETSGHASFYRDSMFDPITVEGEAYQLRPMNCPFHVQVYKAAPRSYRDLPLRWAELGTVYRYERSGTMHGLFRVRGFTQDDAHVFCLPSQIAAEIRGVLDLIEEVLSTFGFSEYEVNLSTRPEKSVGSDEIWAAAEGALVEALDAKGWAHTVDPGGGAFYGPKIDVKIRDALGRAWQCSTVQLDFNLPARFEMEYKGADGSMERPIMIHRAIFGSLERFFGILIEDRAGAFPLWLAPVQLRLLPVNDAVRPYCEEVAAAARAAGLRAEVAGAASIGKLIRNAETAKVPVMAVVGAREAEARALSVRTYAAGELGAMPAEEVIARAAAAAAAKADF